MDMRVFCSVSRWLALVGLSPRSAGQLPTPATAQLPRVRVPSGIAILKVQTHWYDPSRGSVVSTSGTDAAGVTITFDAFRHRDGTVTSTIRRGPLLSLVRPTTGNSGT